MKKRQLERRGDRGGEEKGDGEMRVVRQDEGGETGRKASKEAKKKTLNVRTKDNIIKLPQKAVVATVTKLWRLKGE